MKYVVATLALLALVACDSATEPVVIEEPTPPDVRVETAVVDYRSIGTVVEMVAKNYGGSGVFKLTFWAQREDSTLWVARETEPRVLSWLEENLSHWAVTRDGSHITMQKVEAWSAFAGTEAWVLTDTHVFD